MSNQIDLKTKSLLELKSIAYDLSKVINQYSQMLNTVNNEIVAREEQEQHALMNGTKKAEDPAPTESPTKGTKKKGLTAV